MSSTNLHVTSHCTAAPSRHVDAAPCGVGATILNSNVHVLSTCCCHINSSAGMHSKNAVAGAVFHKEFAVAHSGAGIVDYHRGCAIVLDLNTLCTVDGDRVLFRSDGHISCA